MKSRNSIFLFLSLTISLFLNIQSVDAQMFWNQACQFNGGTDSNHVSIVNSTSLNITGSFTIEAWLSQTNSTSPTSQIVLQKRAGNNANGYTLYLTNGRVVIRTNATTRLIGKTVLQNNVWTHAAGTYNSSTGLFSVYINGVLDTSVTIAGAAPVTNTDSIFIGKGFNSPYAGQMDDLRIWNRPLSATDVAQYFRTSLSASSGPYSGLVLSITFQKNNSGGTLFSLNDGSGTGNNGLNNGVSGVDQSNRPSVTTFPNENAELNGTTDYLAGPNNSLVSPNTAISLEAWIHPRTITGTHVIVGKNAATSYRLNLNSSRKIEFIPKGGASLITSKAIIPTNRWSHVAATYNGLFTNIYINGALDTSFSAITGAIGTNTDSLRIGCDITGGAPTGFFNGFIDEVRISNYLKTADQINGYLFRSIDSANQPNIASANVCYNLDGSTYDNGDGGPKMTFRNGAKFSHPASVDNQPISPLNRSESKSFVEGWTMRKTDKRLPSSGGVGTVDDTISIPFNVSIADINLYVAINHFDDSNLDLFLIAPNGESVDFSTDNTMIGTNDNVTTIFDDQADSLVTSVRYVSFSPAIRPENNLTNVFLGDNSQGLWKLRITDDAGSADTGRLYGWGLQFNNQNIIPYVQIGLRLGQSVVTSFDWTDPSFNVVRVIDIRNRPANVVGGNYWIAPHKAGADWTKAKLGSVYGIALDDNTNPNIFVARSTVFCYEDYTLRPDSAIIYRLDGVNWGVSTYVRCRNISGPPQINVNWIPNTGSGVGNLCYDKQHQQIFVTNHEDGIIYRIGIGGIVLSTFDPFGTDNMAPGFAPLGERLWGIGAYGTNANDVRVYFSKWKTHEFNYNGPNEIWSVALNNIGAFIPSTVRLEITLPVLQGDVISHPVSDIEFSFDGDMLLGERTMAGDMGACDIFGGPFSHRSRILEYARDINGFYNNYILCKVGSSVFNNTNSNGGVDYSYGISDSANKLIAMCDSIIVGTGDALIYDDKNDMYVYGVQVTERSSAGANNFQNYSHYIDLDGIIKSYDDKTYPGDIDVYRKDICSDSQNVIVTPNYRDYATLQGAFTAINAGMHGATPLVTITASFTEPAGAILSGTNITSCTILPSGAVTVTGNFAEAIIVLDNVDNVTIDGRIGGVGTTRSLTLTNINTGLNMGCIRMSNGSSNNRVRYVVCNGVGVGATAGGRIINIGQSSNPTTQGGNNNNIIENNLVNRGRRGIQVFGTSNLTPPGVTNNGTIIRNNIVKNTSAIGIFVGSETRDNTVEGNECFNDSAVAGDTTGFGTRGILIQGVGTNNVTKNKVHDLSFTNSSGTFYVYGLYLVPVTLTAPGTNNSTNNINNNFFALNSDNAASTGTYGMVLLNNASPCTANVYFNTVKLGGTAGAIATQSIGILENIAGTGAYNGANNISINARTGGDITTQHIGSSLNIQTGVTLSSDRNIVFATDTTGRGWNAAYNGLVYNEQLEYWQATCSDSVEFMTILRKVDFISNTDLHLTALVGGDMKGVPIGTITTDIDGQTRNSMYPYKGADEANNPLKIATIGANNEAQLTTAGIRLCNWCVDSEGNQSDCCWDTPSEGPAAFAYGDLIPNDKPFYLVMYSLTNVLETWSAAPISFTSGVLSYDFRTSQSQAFGNNMKSVGGVWSFYVGDINQDGIIEGADNSAVDNDASNSVNGCLLKTDLDANGIVDGGDAIYTDNNSYNYINVMRPTFSINIVGLNSFAKKSSVGVHKGKSIFINFKASEN